MSRLHELLGAGVRVGEDSNGACPVVGADARRDSLGGIHRDREVRPVGFPIDGYHAVYSKVAQLVAH